VGLAACGLTWRPLSPHPFEPEAKWRHAHRFAKLLCEMALAGEAHREADFRNRHIAGEQQELGPLDP